MLSTRSFFKQLAIFGTTTLIAPQILIAKEADRFKWKRSIDIWIPNPAYKDAPCEIDFVVEWNSQGIIFKRIEEDGYICKPTGKEFKIDLYHKRVDALFGDIINSTIKI